MALGPSTAIGIVPHMEAALVALELESLSQAPGSSVARPARSQAVPGGLPSQPWITRASVAFTRGLARAQKQSGSKPPKKSCP